MSVTNDLTVKNRHLVWCCQFQQQVRAPSANFPLQIGLYLQIEVASATTKSKSCASFIRISKRSARKTSLTSLPKQSDKNEIAMGQKSMTPSRTNVRRFFVSILHFAFLMRLWNLSHTSEDDRILGVTRDGLNLSSLPHMRQYGTPWQAGRGFRYAIGSCHAMAP